MAGNRRSGRPRKPTELHVAEGTYRADRHGAKRAEAQEEQAAAAIRRPSGMTRDEAWLWDLVVTELVRRRVVKEIDAPLLQSMCELWGLYRKAYRAAKKWPLDRDARIAINTYWRAFEVAASRFGLNASDRARLQFHDGEQKQKAILARKRG